jgi:tetratricopeptide (TPR) repeat protein
VLLGLAAIAGVYTWMIWAHPDRQGARSEAASPYRNTRPEVHYVGDAACARCHAEIATAFRTHPMGRSLVPIAEAPAETHGESTPRELFEAQGYHYALLLRNGQTLHRETRRNESGTAIGEVEAEVRYMLGSGSRARSFLLERDGYLFASPITWYAQRGQWDLAPGYEVKSPHFERPVTAHCLFCHANRSEHVAGSANHYRSPIFHGSSIGCERCHGPGELHVRQPGGSAQAIVNPRDLEPALRDAVCEQCHLIGENLIERAGRRLSDYRPGLPLEQFETVFVRPPGSREHINAGQVEQMHESRCYQASKGALGCISCHDPHRLPPAEQREAYYRTRCLECHAQRPCSLPVASRKTASPDDSCIACHMPRADIVDVPHVALTIHRIPRHRPAVPADTGRAVPPGSNPANIVPFHLDRLGPEERRSLGRDLGIAFGVNLPADALPLLQEAIRRRPDDVPARAALANVLATLGRSQEAEAAFAGVLAREPQHESALVDAAILTARTGQQATAKGYWRRALAVDPWRSDYHAAVADLLSLSGDWDEAAAACRRALELNPAHIPARLTLVRTIFRLEGAAQASVAFETLLEFDPPDRDGMVRWFEDLSAHERGGGP